MTALRVAFIFVLAVLTAVAASFAQSASLGSAIVAGVVIDDSKTRIPGVTVTATRSGQRGAEVAVTDPEGAFRFERLIPGDYSVEAMLEGFQPVSRAVTLTTNQSVTLAFTIVPAFSETVEVVAQAERTGEVAILDTRRESPVVSDSISSEEISKTPDSDAAAVVERLTGVSLIGDKYVFIRGLGERYSGTTINGAAVPTTETEKRVVPLDLFPAKLLESVNVLKTYTPDKPGDFGSGVVEMTTTQFPPTGVLKLTIGAGYNDATGDDFRRYGRGLSRAGEGGQPLPSDIPSTFLKRQTIFDPNGYTPADLERFGEALVGHWTGSGETASPTTDFALTFGNTFDRLGVIFSAVSNHGYDSHEEEQRFFGLDTNGTLVPRNDYDIATDREHVSLGLVGNISLRANDTNRVSLNSVFTRDASTEDRIQEGLNTNSGGNIRDFRLRYQIEQVLSTRLRGEHNFQGSGIGSLLEWNGSLSQATNESDLRENLYREGAPGVYALDIGVPESGKVDYFDLADDIVQGGLAYTTFFADANATWSGSLIRSALETLTPGASGSPLRIRRASI
jgi:hypothetical protein